MNKKALSLPILISLVIGDMVGTGIYVLPSSLAEYGGLLSLLAWVLTSAGALLLAFTFTRLNQRFHKTGGPYVYCKEAYGPFAGFFIAYTYWLSNLVSIAGIAVSSIGYLGFMTPALDANSPLYSPHAVWLVELGVVWFFTFINILGIRTAGRVQLCLTIIKIIPLLVIGIVGLSHVHLVNLTSPASLSTGHGNFLTGLGSAAALTFWAFIGLEAATVPAENTQGHRDVYKATLWGTAMAAFVYIFCTFVLMGMIPHEALKHSQFPFADAGTLLFGGHAGWIIALCAVLSGLGTLNVCILIQGQIVFAAARDRLFPRQFAKLSQHDVPIAGQILSSVIVSLLLGMTLEPTLLKQFNNLALLAGLLTLITYFAATLSELKFLGQCKLSKRPIFFSKSFLITLLATGYTVWMISSFEVSILYSMVWLLMIAIPIYFIAVKKNMK